MLANDAAVRRTGGVPRDVSWLLTAAALLAAVGWIVFGLSYLHAHAIETRSLFPRGPTYLDLTIYIGRWEVMHTEAFFQPSPVRSTFSYPPAAVFCYAILYGSHHMKFAYNVLTGTWWLTLLAAAGVSFWRMTRSRIAVCGVLAALVLLSFPAVFLFERANMEIFVWIFLLLGGVLYRQGRIHGAAVSFGAATAIKLYPILLFGLFLSRRREWKALLSGALSILACTALAIWYTGPTFSVAARGFLAGFTTFQASYSKGGWLGLLGFDHSLFSPIKLTAVSLGSSPLALQRPYYLLAAVVSASSFLLWVRNRPVENRLTFLLVLMVMLPAVSFEYTLVQLLLPIFLLVSFLLRAGASTGSARRSALLALGGLLFLMLPLDLLGRPGWFYAGQWQVLGLLLVACQAARKDWCTPAPLLLDRLDSY